MVVVVAAAAVVPSTPNPHPFLVFYVSPDPSPPSPPTPISGRQVLEDPGCDREVAMFGYVRGTHLKAGQRVHVIGAGDFGMTEVTALEDPCPLPNKDKVANR